VSCFAVRLAGLRRSDAYRARGDAPVRHAQRRGDRLKGDRPCPSAAKIPQAAVIASSRSSSGWRRRRRAGIITIVINDNICEALIAVNKFHEDGSNARRRQRSFQDAVTAFWRQNAPSGAVRSVAWVALKHEITYRCPAFLDERVDVQMLIERIVGARAYFGATIRRGATVLADVKSVWCSVDITSLRPVRLDRNVRDTFLGGSEATA
jgi:acyl-CoA thioester hydrolase